MSPNGLADRLKHWIFPGICLICGLDSQRPLCLCQGCERSFEVLGTGCQRCAEPMATSGICGHCQKSTPAFERIVAPFVYGPPLDQLINRLKHGHNLVAGQVLAQLLAQHIKPQLQTAPDYLVPMPLHWRRRFSRGFNQASEIARGLHTTLNIPLHQRLVVRTGHTPMQQGLDRDARKKNLRGAFRARTDCRGLHIAVVDDVVTTASTARAVAQALKAAGAEKIEIWCAARTRLEK